MFLSIVGKTGLGMGCRDRKAHRAYRCAQEGWSIRVVVYSRRRISVRWSFPQSLRVLAPPLASPQNPLGSLLNRFVGYEGAPVESFVATAAAIGAQTPQIQNAPLDQATPLCDVDLNAAAMRAHRVSSVTAALHRMPPDRNWLVPFQPLSRCIKPFGRADLQLNFQSKLPWLYCLAPRETSHKVPRENSCPLNLFRDPDAGRNCLTF
jgi:hypothetical protein